MRLLFAIANLAIVLASQERRFYIRDNRFVASDVDVPIQLIAAELHYARIIPAYWEDRLLRIKSMGFNAIQTYVPWNWHCPRPDLCGWTGARDIEAFVQLAQRLDLYVLLRPGPYICAEWDFGGLPWWLGSTSVLGGANMTLRSADPVFLHHVDSFWGALLPRMRPLLYQHGGPIVAVQLENELGYFGADMGEQQVRDYLAALEAIARRYLGPHVLLYTADPPQGIQQGSLPGGAVLSALNFWATSEQELRAHFAAADEINAPGKATRFVAEFYVGNIAHWQEPQPLTSPSTIKTMTHMLLTHANASVSVSFYMVAGGTSWGFYAGANLWWPKYRAHTTSYDFESPISEGGAYGQPGMPPGILQHSKFHLMRDAIALATGSAPPPVVPAPVVYDYGMARALQWLPLLDVLDVLAPAPVVTDLPPTLEDAGQGSGVAVYSTVIPASLLAQGTQLYVGTAVRDFATVLLNDRPIARIDRTTAHDSLAIPIPDDHAGADARLDIVVEAMGHNTFFDASYPNRAFDLKGLLQPPAVNGVPLTNWTTAPLHLGEGLPPLPWGDRAGDRAGDPGPPAPAAPAFVRFELWVDPARRGLYDAHPPDTYLALHGWGKGVAFVNNFNLGWYWASEGPQMTLYLPGPLLKPGLNTITLLELERASPDMTVSCMLQPDFVTPPRHGGARDGADPRASYPEAHRRVYHPTASAA